MVQQNCIDMNAWYSRVDKPTRPDFVLFDLDPPDGEFKLGVEAAHLVREALDELELRSYVKTSGSEGIHVLVPIARRYGFDADAPVRRAPLEAARRREPRRRHDRVAEAQARRRPHRLPPERRGQDDRVRLLGAAEGGRAGLDAAPLGGADAAARPGQVHDGRGAATRREGGRPLRARAPAAVSRSDRPCGVSTWLPSALAATPLKDEPVRPGVDNVHGRHARDETNACLTRVKLRDPYILIGTVSCTLGDHRRAGFDQRSRHGPIRDDRGHAPDRAPRRREPHSASQAAPRRPSQRGVRRT